MQYDLKDRVLAGIVTYNPETERLRQNIEAVIRNEIQTIVIVDNGSNNTDEICRLIEQFPEINIIKNQENKGIAFALNQIFQEAIQSKSIDWVLTLDQDSVIDDDMITTYAHYYSDGNNIASLTSLRREQNYEIPNLVRKEPVQYINKCMTSGNLVLKSAWESVGGFDNRLFIDEVDYDFCYRLREHGYSILRINRPLILHEIGKGVPIYFWGKRRIISNHSAFRKYYMVRNRVYLLRKRKLCDDRYSYLFRFIAKTVLYEKEDRWNKIHSMVKGFIDGLKMK